MWHFVSEERGSCVEEKESDGVGRDSCVGEKDFCGVEKDFYGVARDFFCVALDCETWNGDVLEKDCACRRHDHHLCMETFCVEEVCVQLIGPTLLGVYFPEMCDHLNP